MTFQNVAEIDCIFENSFLYSSQGCDLYILEYVSYISLYILSSLDKKFFLQNYISNTSCWNFFAWFAKGYIKNAANKHVVMALIMPFFQVSISYG